jgi:UDP-N-acetylglucosamine 1-carboxyvinyltransferase
LEGFVIEGGKPLSGSIRVQGAKNAALPILAACVLAEGIFEIHDVPRLSDIEAMCQILEALGAQVIRHQTSIRVNTRLINKYVIQNSFFDFSNGASFGEIEASLHIPSRRLRDWQTAD